SSNCLATSKGVDAAFNFKETDFDNFFSLAALVSCTSQLNSALNESKNSGNTDSTDTSRPSSLVSEVTDLPSRPQGTICWNQARSTLQLMATPCEVSSARVPKPVAPGAQIHNSSLQPAHVVPETAAVVPQVQHRVGHQLAGPVECQQAAAPSRQLVGVAVGRICRIDAANADGADIFNIRRLSSRMPLFSAAHVHCESAKKFASVHKSGSLYMTYPDFVQKFLGLYCFENANEDTVKQLGTIADYDKDGLISFEEFETFEGLLSLPDHAYRIAFDLFDVNGNGYVSFSEFKIGHHGHHALHRQYPFNFDCDFIDLHFGKARDQIVSYEEFTQLIHRQTQRGQNSRYGLLSTLWWQLKSNLLTPFLRDHLMQVVFGAEHGSHISFSYFNAFISLLNNMELLKKLIQARTGNDVHAPVTREELTNDAMSYNQLTPLEVDILFQLAKFLREDDCISYYDVKRMAPFDEYTSKYAPDTAARRVQDAVETRAEGRGRTFLLSILEQVYRFSLGAIAGAIGATAVYPIDLVKTRMQNQRTSTVGEVLYRNSWDCFKEGHPLRGRLVPQLVGVAPEKAIKLTMNDLVKDQFRDKKTGFIPLWARFLLAAAPAAPRSGCRWRARSPPHRGSPRCICDSPIAKATIIRGSLLLAATLSGAPSRRSDNACGCVARSGQTTYTDPSREGPRAFWKGSMARVCPVRVESAVRRHPPHTYEMLQRAFYIDFGG
uniref:EF-hand domain-containing protein n=1 Tax=Macrostomum lignano TaxID=282301 RepID=A0A1I8IT28_9PLAT